MDTRFPPPLDKVEVPLYPEKSRIKASLRFNSSNKLTNLIASTVHIPQNQITLTASATAALYAYLLADKKKSKVALPSFCCPSVVSAIIDAGHTPVFIDVDSSLQPSKKNIQYVIERRCRYFLWPNYFGFRQRSPKLVRQLHLAGIRIILDEAQAFPLGLLDSKCIEFQMSDAMLVSFGPTKPLAGVGGGALIVPKQSSQFRAASEHIIMGKRQRSRQFSLLVQSIKEKLGMINPRLAYLLHAKKRPLPRLDSLLVQTTIHWDGCLQISNYHASIACRNWERFNQHFSRHQERYMQLCRMLVDIFGQNSLRMLKDVHNTPAIMAIELPPKLRYDFFSYCAAQNIQTTWYYYPLSLLPQFKRFESENIPSSLRIAQSIVILPFQWTHSEAHFTFLMKKLRSYRIEHED